MASSPKKPDGPLKANAKARYASLARERNTALDRAKSNSKLTIPGLVPEDGQDAGASFDQPWQSLGARGVNNLASWLLITLFPPDTSFLRLSIHEDTAAELGAGLSKVKEGLSKISAKALMLMEGQAARPVFMETLRHLIVAGNALLHVPVDGGTPRMFRLDQFALLRNERGELLEVVVREGVYASALDEAVRAACKVEFDPAKPEANKRVDLYTHVKRDGENLTQYQEINGEIVPGSEGTSPYEARGWLPLRWQAVPGSDYGRAMASEYAGDLLSLEDLSKAIIQFAAAASRIVHVVDPGAMIDIDELNSAETGDYITGYRDKIGTLQLEKSQDFQVANLVAERLEQRLSNAFMLRSGMTRNAERVTAEEIRAAAQELENVLGGTYTVLSAEFQLVYAKRLLYILTKQGSTPDLPESVKPTIVTGFEAMGRSHSASKLKAMLQDISTILGPTYLTSRIDGDEVMRRFGESYGVEAVEALFRPEEQVQQDQQAGAMQAAMVAAAPQLAKGASDAFNNQEPQ